MAKRKNPVDPTAAQRMARLKARLEEGGGKRVSINLNGKLVKKLDKLMKDGAGCNRSDVIRNLIAIANSRSLVLEKVVANVRRSTSTVNW